MKSQIKESKPVGYSPHFKTSHKNSISHSNVNEINNRGLTEPFSILNLNSKFAEETVNTINDYFSNHSFFTSQFIKTFEREIESSKSLGSEEKLGGLLSEYSEASDLTYKLGFKTILDAFVNYNESVSTQKNDPHEDIDFIIEPFVEKHISHLIWVDQTIIDPWYKN